MKQKISWSLVAATVTGAGITACAAGVAPPLPEAAPEVLGIEVAPVEEEVVRVSRAPEPSLRDRWASPFAVSSEGTVTPRQPRQVVILDSDPAISAGIAEQRLVDLADEPAPRAGGSRAAVSSTAGAGSRSSSTSAGSAVTRAESVATDPTATADDARQHRVAAGDTLSGIARRYGVSVDAIRALNRLQGDRIQLGQLLRLPPAAN